jgi:hypothetical protein
MPEPIITTGVALVGAGTWFAGKVFGPSAGEIGTQLKMYLSGRVRSIFRRAEETAEKMHLEISPVAPGLLARMIADASFSADADDITEWWANLFLNASSHSSTNKHAVFSDMMAVVGPEEAACLKTFIESFGSLRSVTSFRQLDNLASVTESMQEETIRHWVGDIPVPENNLRQIYLNLTNGEMSWPTRPIAWSFPLDHGDKVTKANQVNPWYRDNLSAVGVLERTRILEFSKVTLGGQGTNAWVKLISVTPLGVDFFEACTGRGLPREAPGE